MSSDQADRDAEQETHGGQDVHATPDDMTLVLGSLPSGAASGQVVTGNFPQQLADDTALIVPPPSWGAVSDQLVVGDIPQRPQGFQPRPYLMAQLNQTGPEPSVARVVTGRRGVGKTQLAAAYAQVKQVAGWRLVAWVNASDTSNLLAGLGAVADAAGLRRDGSAYDAADAGLMVRRLLEVDGDRCLLVFDDAEDPDVLRPFVPASGTARVLITTTRQSVEDLGISIPVEVFDADEAHALLVERTGLTDEEGASAVAAELGHLPLALAQATPVIAARRWGYRAYLERLQAVPVQEYLMRQEGPPYPQGVAEAVLLSLDAVPAGDRAGVCTGILEMMSVLSGRGVRRELLHAAGRAGALARRRRRPRVSAELVDRALERLAERSLLNFSVNGQTVIAHRLVMQVVHDVLARQMRLTALYRAAASVLDTRAAALAGSPDRAAGRDILEQMRTLREEAGSAAGADDELARMLLSLSFWELYHLNKLGGSAPRAIAVGEPLVADFERALGLDHPDTLTARDNLAAAYVAAGRAAEAIPLYEGTLAICERLWGADHPRTLNSRGSLAAAYGNAGRVSEAIPLLELTLAGRGRALGPDHPDTLTTLNNLGAAYRDAGWVAEAIPLLELTLAARERLLGADHTSTLTTLHNLAKAYWDAGRVAEATRLFERALAACERLLGPDHDRTLSSRDSLAAAYRDTGRAAQAIPLFERNLAACERRPGVEDPRTLSARENLIAARLEAAQAEAAGDGGQPA